MIYITILCILSSHVLINGQKLGTYNIDKTSVTVSGISSGGAMAAQLHVAFSSLIKGAGIIAGPPYYCAKGSSVYATTGCMTGLGMVTTVTEMTSKANSASNLGQIDSTSNLKNHYVYLYSGSKDTVVYSAVVKKNEDFYKAYMDASRIKTVYNVASAHAHITENYGGACGTTNTAYINNCDYHQSYDLLNHLYQTTFVRPAKTYKATGTMIQFDQKEFWPTGYLTTSSISMDTTGYVYVPLNCANSQTQCKLHIALHGCLQAAKNIQQTYVLNAGYNEVADLNDFIILYPQAYSNANNPNACWDWWAYINANYVIKSGPQMAAIRNMISRLASV